MAGFRPKNFMVLPHSGCQAKEACADCPHFNYCMGGCLYNMLTANTDKDPYCEVYKSVFNTISQDMALEMAGIMMKRLDKKDAPLLTMTGNFPHPFDKMQQHKIDS